MHGPKTKIIVYIPLTLSGGSLFHAIPMILNHSRYIFKTCRREISRHVSDWTSLSLGPCTRANSRYNV